jgi:hypothetical protein
MLKFEEIKECYKTNNPRFEIKMRYVVGKNESFITGDMSLPDTKVNRNIIETFFTIIKKLLKYNDNVTFNFLWEYLDDKTLNREEFTWLYCLTNKDNRESFEDDDEFDEGVVSLTYDTTTYVYDGSVVIGDIKDSTLFGLFMPLVSYGLNEKNTRLESYKIVYIDKNNKKFEVSFV